jgi:hypothetical protein
VSLSERQPPPPRELRETLQAIGRRFGRHDGQQYFELFRAKLLQRIGEGKQRVEGECVGRQRDD